MKRFITIILLAMVGMFFINSIVMAQPVPEAIEVAEAFKHAKATAESDGVLTVIWNLANSPLGIFLIGSILAFLGGKILIAKPKYKVYVDKYAPTLIRLIKSAEKAIPDGTTNSGAQKADQVLKWMLEINKKLNPEAVKEAITDIHAGLEKNGNLKK
jgi:hypothetical protein